MFKAKIEKLGILLEPIDNNVFEQKAVLNPAVYQEGKTVHIFYRAVDKLFRSTIGYARLDGPTNIVERWDKPFMKRERQFEKRGVEDPRVTKIGDTFYMTYVAHDGKNAVTAYAQSKNILKLKKEGIITPLETYGEVGNILRSQNLKDRYFLFEAYYEDLSGEDVLLWAKDTILFPRKINNQYAMLIRILPDIQLIYFDNFEQLRSKAFWRKYIEELDNHVVLENRYWYESRNVGGGATPIEIPEGWLVIYHSVEERNSGRIYHASAALLDKKDPTKVIARLSRPLFSPDQEWEIKGDVDNVVFPTGTSQFGEDLYIYYGAADRVIAVARVPLRRLVRELLKTGLQ